MKCCLMSGGSSAGVTFCTSVETGTPQVLHVFVHIIVVCQCEDILGMERGYTAQIMVIGGMELVKEGNQILIQFKNTLLLTLM